MDAEKKAPQKRIYCCDKCHQKKPDVKKTVDPYEQDVHGKQVKGKWCEACLSDIAAEI